jgi:hypothetical protein
MASRFESRKRVFLSLSLLVSQAVICEYVLKLARVTRNLWAGGRDKCTTSIE